MWALMVIRLGRMVYLICTRMVFAYWTYLAHNEDELEMSGEALGPCSFQLTPLGEVFTYPRGGQGHGIQIVHVQGLHCRCSFQELWPEGHWCMSGWQPNDLLVDTSSDGGLQVVEGGFQDLVVLEDSRSI